MARKTKEEAEKTFQLLLSTAADLFITQGVSNTTLNDIAKAAQLTRGAIYWHFQGKDDIIRAMWETNLLPKIDPLSARFWEISKETPLEDFKSIMSDFSELMTHDKQAASVMRIAFHNVEQTTNQSELQIFLDKEKQEFIDALVHSFTMISKKHPLRDKFTPENAALGMSCLMHGILDHFLLDPESFNFQTLGNALIHTYLDGVTQSN